MLRNRASQSSTSNAFSPSDSQTADAEKKQIVHIKDCFKLSVIEFQHEIQEAIFSSIKQSYRHSVDEEKKLLISSEKTENSPGLTCTISHAVSKSVVSLMADLKDLSQQLQEPCQKLLTMYLDNLDEVDETDFDISDLSEEEQELLNISRASHEVISKGLPSVDPDMSADERWLLEHNDTVSNRREESDLTISYKS